MLQGGVTVEWDGIHMIERQYEGTVKECVRVCVCVCVCACECVNLDSISHIHIALAREKSSSTDCVSE